MSGRKIINGLTEALAHARGGKAGRVHVRNVPRIDVRAIRKGLDLTQEEFAERFGFSVGALRHWEQGRRQPDAPARAYLTVIARDPRAVQAALTAAAE